MDEPTFFLEVPNTPPHVTMLILAHVDWVSHTTRTMVAAGMPPPQARKMLMEHASLLRFAGDQFGIAEAASDIANGVEAFADAKYPAT